MSLGFQKLFVFLQVMFYIYLYISNSDFDGLAGSNVLVFPEGHLQGLVQSDLSEKAMGCSRKIMRVFWF